ncbi:MAG: hypothetical protein ACRDCE_19775 [Cetobacterium sp.]|uniref:hypothetical protein n=1 Tax=Cetobacterium sp. TaxID=2071632 RepID=UPI003EE675EA
MKKLVVLAVIALSGCVTKVDQIPHNNGGDGYLIECNGSLQTFAACYKRASEVCKGGTYEVSNEQSFESSFLFMGVPYRSMVIKCDTMYSEEEFNRLMQVYSEQFVK